MQKLKSYLQEQKIDFEEFVSLKKKTWIKRGGITDFWILPQKTEELQKICSYCYANHLFFEIVGHTSNLYFYNDYNPNIVISTIKLTNYIIKNTEIECEAGVPIAKLSHQCIEKGFIGYEGLIGLPGTVASAVYNNSGCFDCSISKLLIKATLLQEDGCIREIYPNDLNYTKRSSSLKRKELRGVILKVILKCNQSEDLTVLISKAIKNKEIRNKTQEGPLNNLGSICGAISGYKKSYRNFIVKLLLKIYMLFNKPTEYKKHKFTKEIILAIYNRKELSKYISDYNMNCFIWKDADADIYFDRYIALLNNIYNLKDHSLEIEIKANPIE